MYFSSADVHWVLRWRGTGLDHSWPGEGAHWKTGGKHSSCKNSLFPPLSFTHVSSPFSRSPSSRGRWWRASRIYTRIASFIGEETNYPPTLAGLVIGFESQVVEFTFWEFIPGTWKQAMSYFRQLVRWNLPTLVCPPRTRRTTRRGTPSSERPTGWPRRWWPVRRSGTSPTITELTSGVWGSPSSSLLRWSPPSTRWPPWECYSRSKSLTHPSWTIQTDGRESSTTFWSSA